MHFESFQRMTVVSRGPRRITNEEVEKIDYSVDLQVGVSYSRALVYCINLATSLPE